MHDTRQPPSTEALTEAEIRPTALLEEQARRFARDIARLHSRRGEFVDVSCPACASSERTPAWVKYELDFVTCQACRTIYINPRPTPEILDEYYAKSENYAYWNDVIFPASEQVRRSKIFVPRVDRILEICDRFGTAPGTLLEVGAGFGTFCHELIERQRFARVLAVEPTPALAATCRSRGIEVFETPIEKLDLPPESLDIAVSFEVIEHLFEPRRFLEAMHRYVRPGGIIVVSCPNGEGFDVRVLGERSVAVDPEHLNYFNPESLSRLCSEVGFEPIEISTPGKLDAELVRKEALSGGIDLSRQPFLEDVLLRRWAELGQAFQTFLASNCLSSHMWFVGRRVER